MYVYLGLAILLGLLIIVWYRGVSCCASNCPNKVWWWQDPVDWGPGMDVPRPEECCPPPSTPSTTAPAASPPAPSAAPLDTSNATTDTTQCDQTWQMQPSVTDPTTGIVTVHLVVTPCIAVGKCMSIQMTDMSKCLASTGEWDIFFLGDPVNGYYEQATSHYTSLMFGGSLNLVDLGTGTGVEKGTSTAHVPNLSSMLSPTGTNIMTWCFTSDTTTDFYINGTKVGTITHPSQPINAFGYNGACYSDPIYAKVTPMP
jgi:hypothetical protein